MTAAIAGRPGLTRTPRNKTSPSDSNTSIVWSRRPFAEPAPTRTMSYSFAPRSTYSFRISRLSGSTGATSIEQPQRRNDAEMKSELLSATVPERCCSRASHSSRGMISSPVGMKSVLGAP